MRKHARKIDEIDLVLKLVGQWADIINAGNRENFRGYRDADLRLAAGNAAFELAQRLGATNAHLAHFVRVTAANESDRAHEERLRRLVNSEEGGHPGAVHISDVAYLLGIVDELRFLLRGKYNERR